MKMIDILLFYVRKGADIIRLDAVTYLWAELGTECAHLKQTHEIIKLFRIILDAIAPSVALITETNVPHDENIAYFGNGCDEAQMVYNFARPPLVLYTFYKEDATVLNEWAKTLEPPSRSTTFFNFLDSHDGIGLMAVKNILPEDEIDLIVEIATERGGLVSYKTSEDGDEEPYEINITWFSALNQVEGDEDPVLQVKRFVASRLIALVLKGVPGIYLHSLIGTQNDILAVRATRSNREINRTVLDHEAIEAAMKDPSSRISLINRELGRFISLRSNQRAFHPNGAQRILSLSPEVFSVLRTSPERDRHLLSLINITAHPVHLNIPLSEIQIGATRWYDTVRDRELETRRDVLSLDIPPYEAFWLIPSDEI
jgi:sucrose phosphorylase